MHTLYNQHLRLMQTQHTASVNLCIAQFNFKQRHIFLGVDFQGKACLDLHQSHHRHTLQSQFLLGYGLGTNTLTMRKKKGVMFKESLTLTCMVRSNFETSKCLHTVTESTLNERSKIFYFLLLLTILPYQNVHLHLTSIFPKYMAIYYH